MPLALTTQQNPPWALSAMSSRTPGPQPYRYDDSASQNTFAYVLDSGVHDKHVEFGGRVAPGWSVYEEDFPDRPHGDVTGHGTMVAGIIASNTYGVAKKANIIAVQTDQTVSGLLGGIAWAVRDIQSQGRVGQAVINYSGGTYARSSAPLGVFCILIRSRAPYCFRFCRIQVSTRNCHGPEYGYCV